MKTVLAGAGLAAAMVVASSLPSFADVVTGNGSQGSPARLANYGTDGTIAFAVPTVSNPQGLVTETQAGKFTYDFFFQVDSPATLTGISASSSTSYKKAPNISFTSFAITQLFGATAPNSNGNAYFPTTTYTLAANTTYELVLTGNLTGGTGKFNGNLSVSAVPLPTSVALFGTAILGLGVFGAVRRKKVVSAATA